MRWLKKEIVIGLMITLFSFNHFWATEVSLQKKLNQATSKEDSITLLIAISEKHRFTQPEKGLEFAKKALQLSLLQKDTFLMIESANKLALLEKENSINSTALGTIIKALSWGGKLKNNDLLASTQLIAGHIYSDLGNTNQAIEYYNKCLLFFKNTKDSSSISYTYSGLGIVYYDKQDYQKALSNYLNAENFWIDAESTLKADLWNNIGALYVDLKDYQKASLYYQKALKHYNKGELTSEIAMVYDNLGELSLFQNDYSTAFKYYQKALNIGKKIGSPTERMWANEGLYNVTKKEQKFEKALHYHEIYSKLKDSLDKVQNKKEVAEIESLFHQEEHLKKIKEQKLQIINAEQKVDAEKLKNIIYVTFSILIFTLFIFGLILYLKSRKVSEILRDQKATITHSLREKELLLKEIHHRVKNNLQVISSLLNLQRNVVNNKSPEYIIDETQNRISAIALVHQKLYQSSNIGEIDLSVYLVELIEQQKHIYEHTDNPVKCIMEVPKNIEINIDVAISLGLIVSELTTNAFKYAFTDKHKKENSLKLSLKSKENSYQLIISDNGQGLPKDYENGKKESLGLELVKILAEQINGKLSYKNENGAVFTIQFKS